MSLINIGRENAADAFYRYKMPVVQTQILKPNTNGSRTVVRLLGEVASALNQDLSHEVLAKYLSYALGAKEATSQGQTQLAGMYSTAVLTDHVQDFADEFARCPKCHDPELDLKIQKSGIRATCRACSFNGKLVLKRKAAKKLEEFLAKQVTKRLQSESKGESKQRPEPTRQSEEANASLEKSDTDKKFKKKKKKPKESDDDVVWFTDTSPEAQAARLQEELSVLTIKFAANGSAL